jgi:3-deoxy-manno-octulosonate cytidylyltransferase (CMP-KDO synthetase)
MPMKRRRERKQSRDSRGLLFDFKKHTGLYAYRRDFLLGVCALAAKLKTSAKESTRADCRALDRGVKIKVVEAASPSIGVDTLEDLERVRSMMSEPASVSRARQSSGDGKMSRRLLDFGLELSASRSRSVY